jgi:hypothetical protein
VPLNLLLPRKSFLTLDGIMRRVDPDFNAWLETRGSTGPISIRSGLPTRTLAAQFAGSIRKEFVQMHNHVGAFRKSVRCSVQKLRNHPKPSPRKQRKEERKKHEC